jgi:hypothetical protein
LYRKGAYLLRGGGAGGAKKCAKKPGSLSTWPSAEEILLRSGVGLTRHSF